MGITARLLAGQAPLVQVVVTAGTVPAGRPWTVTGTARGESWPVRAGRGTSDGGQIVLADALAPVNVPLTYRVAWESGAAESEPVVRPWAGRSLLTDATGAGGVDVLWQGDDARDVDPRVTAHEVVGRSTPVLVWAASPGAGTLSLPLRTTGPAASRALLALVTRPTVALLFHNPRYCYQCRRGVCDVPLVTTLAVTGASHHRARRQDVAERIWTLKCTVAAVPESSRALAVSSWDNLDAAGLTWDRVDAMGLTWDSFDATVWQEV